MKQIIESMKTNNPYIEPLHGGTMFAVKNSNHSVVGFFFRFEDAEKKLEETKAFIETFLAEFS